MAITQNNLHEFAVWRYLPYILALNQAGFGVEIFLEALSREFSTIFWGKSQNRKKSKIKFESADFSSEISDIQRTS